MEESQQLQRYGLEKRGMARSSQASPFLLSSFLLIVLPLCRTLLEAERCNLQGPISSLYDTELSKGRVTNGSEVNGSSASIAQYWKWGRRIQVWSTQALVKSLILELLQEGIGTLVA